MKVIKAIVYIIVCLILFLVSVLKAYEIFFTARSAFDVDDRLIWILCIIFWIVIHKISFVVARKFKVVKVEKDETSVCTCPCETMENEKTIKN